MRTLTDRIKQHACPFTGLAVGAVMLAGVTGAVAQEYEYEPDEGYHQEEWFDPSDWLNEDNQISYEDEWGYDYSGDTYDDEYYDPYNDYGDDAYYEPYGYYDDDDYEYGYHYDEAQNEYEYGWHFDDFAEYDALDYDYDYDYTEAQDTRDRNVDYRFNQTRRGEIVGLKRIRGASFGQPDRVVLKLRTEDGNTRTVSLGDIGYVSDFAQKLKKGEKVAIGGRIVNVNGRDLFKAEEIRVRDSAYDIPEYEYNRTIRGEITGLRRVRARNGNLDAVVARVRGPQGQTRNVLLGRTEDLKGKGKTIRPHSRVRVEGYKRIANGQSHFVVQDVKILDAAQRDRQRQQQMQRRPDQRQKDQRQRDQSNRQSGEQM